MQAKMAIASLLFVRIYRKTTRRQLHISAEIDQDATITADDFTLRSRR
jgi:hypothetical protein